MKKVLIVTTIQNTIEAFLISHIKFLEEKGYEVVLATNIFKEIPKELEGNRWINIPFSRNPFSLSSFTAIREMRRLFRDEKFEFVHFHTPVAAFLGRYAAMREKQKNIIYTAHGFHFFEGAPRLSWIIYYPLEVIGSKWTDKLITINEEDYIRAQEFKLRENGKVYKVSGVGLDIQRYQNGDADKLRKELQIGVNEKLILMIGELNKNKNQIQLLYILERLKLKGKSVRGIFVGVGDQEEILKEKAKELGVKVSFLGYRHDITDLIASCDILCSMSYREGLPRNLMEGMCQGKPLIATDIRGNRDLIVDGENGYLIGVNEVEEASKIFYKLLNDRELYEKVSKKSLESAYNYSVDKVLEEMREVYGYEEVSNSQS